MLYEVITPLSHLDVMGSLLLIVVGFGWAKPVPVNPYALRRHSKSAYMWVSLAGPVSNFFLAAFAAIPIRFNLIPLTYSNTGVFPTLADFLIEFIVINLALMRNNFV